MGPKLFATFPRHFLFLSHFLFVHDTPVNRVHCERNSTFDPGHGQIITLRPTASTCITLRDTQLGLFAEHVISPPYEPSYRRCSIHSFSFLKDFYNSLNTFTAYDAHSSWLILRSLQFLTVLCPLVCKMRKFCKLVCKMCLKFAKFILSKNICWFLSRIFIVLS